MEMFIMPLLQEANSNIYLTIEKNGKSDKLCELIAELGNYQKSRKI